MGRPRNTRNPNVKEEWRPIADAIMTARQRSGMTQRDLAAKLGIDVTTLAHYELGTRSIPRERVAACSRVLGAPHLLEMLLGRQPAARSARGTPLPTADDIFADRRLGAWWAAQSSALYEHFDISVPEVDACRNRVFSWTRELIAVRGLDPVTVSAEIAIELASSCLPAVEAGYAERRRASAAA